MNFASMSMERRIEFQLRTRPIDELLTMKGRSEELDQLINKIIKDRETKNENR